jgi:hypothetical protein
MLPSFFFGIFLVLCAAVVVTERKRGQRWRKIAESWVPFLLPSFLGGLGWVYPRSSGVVSVLFVLLLVGAFNAGHQMAASVSCRTGLAADVRVPRSAHTLSRA